MEPEDGLVKIRKMSLIKQNIQLDFVFISDLLGMFACLSSYKLQCYADTVDIFG
jgi:hypothetical protein